MKFGSVCSGIEAASLAFKSSGMEPLWFSENADFPSKVLEYHYPDIPNKGDMNDLPDLIRDEKLPIPEVLCGGTPCQAFSLAGWKQGLVDTRGQLTLKFIEVADAIDEVRHKYKLPSSMILWENVEGVLRDKTNAFGLFLAGLAGLNEEISNLKWKKSGVLYGPKRNIAWRILDAKYFGLPQQRKRLFLLATNTTLHPEKILFELLDASNSETINFESLYTEEKKGSKKSSFDNLSVFQKDKTKAVINDTKFEVFRSYTDSLYAAYGTKWNGNAAAYNGSLYVAQNDRVRRMTPLECERLMGFPDGYTDIPGASDTNRYQALGNSWAIPVVEWLGERIKNHKSLVKNTPSWINSISPTMKIGEFSLFQFEENFLQINLETHINVSNSKNKVQKGKILEVLDTNPKEKFYISARAAAGILRRESEKKINMNESLKTLFKRQSEIAKTTV